MYKMHVSINLIGRDCNYFKYFRCLRDTKNMSYSCEFTLEMVEAVVQKSQVIVLNLEGLIPNEMLARLVSIKSEDSELLIIIGSEATQDIMKYTTYLSKVFQRDVPDYIADYQVSNWQQAYVQRWDYWEAQQVLETCLESTPNMMWVKSKEGIHTHVNTSFCKVVHKTKGQVTGQRHAYIWDVDEDDPVCIASENDVMASGRVGESQEIIKSGEDMRELHVFKAPLYNPDGTPMGTLGIGIDVTSEQLYRKEVIAKGETLEKIFTTLNCGVIRHSIDGKHILSINQAALSILGYDTQEEMMSDGFSLIAQSVLDEDKVQLRNAINGLKHEGDSVSIEYRVKHKDGKVVYVVGDIKLLRDDNEFIYQRFLLDYTFQKMQSDKMEQEYSEMIQALSQNIELVCYFDIGIGLGKVVREKESTKDHYGGIFEGDILFDGSMRYYIDKFVHPEDKEEMLKYFKFNNIKSVLRNEECIDYRYRIELNDKVYWYQISVAKIQVEGSQDGVVVGFSSIDEAVRKEKERNAFLEDALEQAQRACDSKTTFLANMSHDIRTPINAIIGFTTLAISHYSDQLKVKEYLDKIMKSSRHMLQLLNNVLDMSSIESGVLSVDKQAVSLGHVITQVMAIIHQEHSDASIMIDAEVNIKHNDVYCDSLRLNQVLLNLMMNAIRYTKEGSVKLIVHELDSHLQDYSSYEFIVRDTGIGIDEAFLPDIFKPFTREQDTTSSGILGTGLGLTIVKHIVDLMGGSISVQSKKNKGSEFRVLLELPFVKVDNTTVSAEDFDPTKYRILIVEDNELNQEIADELLTELGFNTELASNGQEAVVMLAEKPKDYYSLILMDIQMPIMNGYEATRTIRSTGAKLPILAMTANAFESDKQESLRSGMNAHIAKPIDIDYVYTTIREFLTEKK